VFDPDRIADLEVDMWKAYYRKEKVRLGWLLVLTLREQYRMTWASATLTGYRLGRAAADFSDLRSDYDQVLPDLERGYRRIARATDAPFDPHEVAIAELAWWVARRDPEQQATENVGRLIGETYALLYDTTDPRVYEAGQLRAQAATLRDEHRQSPPWEQIETLLGQSWRTLHEAVAP
jgi:hypothetical protein